MNPLGGPLQRELLAQVGALRDDRVAARCAEFVAPPIDDRLPPIGRRDRALPASCYLCRASGTQRASTAPMSEREAGLVRYRGESVAVHRAGCSNLRELVDRSGERVIDVASGALDSAHPVLYAVDVSVGTSDRPGLLRDVSEVLAKEKINVTGVRSQSPAAPRS
jgi:hypothetical protein